MQGVRLFAYLGVLPAALAFGTLLTHCGPDDGFECGTRMPTDEDRVRTCSRNLEVCICATGSCARHEVNTTTAGSGGTSGEGCKYRYVDRPFAAERWAGKCVPDSHLEYPIVPTDAQRGPLCPTIPQYPTGGTAGATGSGGTVNSAGGDAGATEPGSSGASSGGATAGIGGEP